MNQEYLLTPGGLTRLEQRIRAARAAYQGVIDDNPAALEAGDNSGWHDNFAYEENQRQMHQLARRVRDLELLRQRVRLAPLLATADRARVGTAVRFQFEGEDQVRACWIAGYDDGNPERGRVSYNSPLGRTLLGAEAGDTREVIMAERRRTLLLLDVGLPVAADADREVLP